MQKKIFADFKKIIIDNLLESSGTLSSKTHVLFNQAKEIKSSGGISGYEFRKLVSEYYDIYDENLNNSLQYLNYSLSEFNQTPNKKQFEELKGLYTSYYVNSLSQYKDKLAEVQEHNESTMISFNIKKENTIAKISSHFFKESKSIKSRNSIDIIKFCTIIGVILTACAPLIEKIWEYVFGYIANLFLTHISN